jgi:hypothetical protein
MRFGQVAGSPVVDFNLEIGECILHDDPRIRGVFVESALPPDHLVEDHPDQVAEIVQRSFASMNVGDRCVIVYEPREGHLRAARAQCIDPFYINDPTYGASVKRATAVPYGEQLRRNLAKRLRQFFLGK